MTDVAAPIVIAAAALAAGRDPRPALDRWQQSGAAPAGNLPAPVSPAHLLAARIAVAAHAGASAALAAQGGRVDDPLTLLPELLALAQGSPQDDTQLTRQLTQMQATLGVYYDDAETLRQNLTPSLWSRLIARSGA